MTMLICLQQLEDVVQRQIKDLKQIDTIGFSVADLTEKETDTSIVKGVKATLRNRKESDNLILSELAADLLEYTIKQENNLVDSGKHHRKLAKDQFDKAEALFNARSHFLATGDSLPLALELNRVSKHDLETVKKYVKDQNIPNYFKQQKEAVQNSTTS